LFLTAEKATIIGDIAREAFVFIGTVKENWNDLYFEIYRSLFATSGFVCAAGNHTECLFVAAAAKHRPFCFQLKRFFDAAVGVGGIVLGRCIAGRTCCSTAGAVMGTFFAHSLFAHGWLRGIGRVLPP